MKIVLLVVVGIIRIFGIIYVLSDDDGSQTPSNEKYLSEFTKQDIREFEMMMYRLTNQKIIIFSHVNLDRLDQE